MSSDIQTFLVNGATPVASNEFQVRAGAVRLFGANLGVIYNIEVRVGDEDSFAWVPAYLNSVQLQLSDVNNILPIIVAGSYRVVTSDDSDPVDGAMVYLIESDTTDHDDRVMYVLQTPAPAGATGGGGGGTPSDTVTEVGVDFSRTGDPGASLDYSRGDHIHYFSALPSGVVSDCVTALAATTTDIDWSIDNVTSIFGSSIREIVVAQAAFDISTTSTSVTPPLRVPLTVASSGLNLGIIDLAGYGICQNGVNPIPIPVSTNIQTGEVIGQDVRNYLGSLPNWSSGGTITITVTYALGV